MKNGAETVKKRYNRLSLLYDILEYPFERLIFGKWRRNLFSNLDGRILEIGVGTGKNLQYYPKEAKVTAIDISPGMLGRAIKKAGRLKLDYSLILMDAEDLGFKENSFDVVACTFVLCSVPDPVKALNEMRRVCKPNGKIVVIEHVLSKNRIIALLQHIHNPVTRYLFGFNVNRDTVSNIKKAGLKITSEKNLALNGVFKIITCRPDKK